MLNDRVIGLKGTYRAQASRVLGSAICLDINALQPIDKVSLIHHYIKVPIWFI